MSPPSLRATARLRAAWKDRMPPWRYSLRLDVGDVQKAVAADAKVDKGGLNAGLEVDHLALVDVADVIVLAGSFDVQLFEDGVLDNRDPTLLGLRDVDQHFLLHCVAFPRPRRKRRSLLHVFVDLPRAADRCAAKTLSAGAERRFAWAIAHTVWVARGREFTAAKPSSELVSNRSPDALHSGREESLIPSSPPQHARPVLKPLFRSTRAACSGDLRAVGLLFFINCSVFQICAFHGPSLRKLDAAAQQPAGKLEVGQL